MYSGPSRNPLLPKDFEEPSIPTPEDSEQNENKEELPKGDENQDNLNNGVQSSESKHSDWQQAKNLMSRYASGKSNNFKGAISKYVKAQGGSKNAARTAKVGVKSTSKIGQFFSTASSQGIRETLKQAKIDFEGRSAIDILNDIINLLAPIPITKEDSVARKSLIRTMEVLYEKIEDENKDISTLEKINKELLNEIIPIQIESFIYERIINDLGSRIEINSTSAADAISKEHEIKEYINAKVEVTLRGRDFSQMDFNAVNIDKEVESLFNQCYKVMEDML